MALSAMSETSVVAGELEKVRQMGAFSVLYERDDVFLTKIEKRTDIEIVSNRAARIPIQLVPGGSAAQSSADGSGLGRGSGTTYGVFQVSTLFFKLAVEMTLLSQWATDSDAKARFNAVKREVQNGTKAFRTFLDRIAHTSGNGILATTSANATTTTITCDTVQLLTPNMQITMYTSNQGTQRSGGTGGAIKYVTSVDYVNNTVTIDNAYSDATNGDVICVGGLSGATPTSLYGIPYYHATSGSVLGLARSSYPQLVTPSVTASSVLTPAHPRQLLTRIRQALGVSTSAVDGGFFLAHPNQVAAWEELAVITQSTNPGGKVPDPLYNIESGVTAANRPFVEDLNQPKTRIDFINPKAWGRTVVKDVDLIKIGDATVFPTYSTSDGAPNSSFVWYLGTQFQLFCENPRAGGFISSLTTPAGYL